MCGEEESVKPGCIFVFNNQLDAACFSQNWLAACV